MPDKHIIFIVGPTAVGKTEVAYLLAQQMDAEIVSCDAMQVYRDVGITTNNPPRDILNRVPHHLMGIRDVEEEFDVAAFRDLALQAIQDIQARQKTVLIAGGSGMYMQVLLDGIFQGAPKQQHLRDELWQRFEAEGAGGLMKELEERDPAAAQKIHPHDVRRLIRALEICRSTGQPFSQLKKERQGLWGRYAITLVALNRPREELYACINARVERMFDEGMVEEIRRLLHRPLSLTARRIIGVSEVAGYLNRDYDEDRARYLVKLHTRHYAKRQLTWFRKEQRLCWVDIRREMTAGVVADYIRTNLCWKA
ncbi:MAG: tRNA (adenosine(37)-N6)-dimethylallyltransferase MiaA [Candidatus Omnitrophota bacterium]|jgi:tRNA dimethylallyltransferase